MKSLLALPMAGTGHTIGLIVMYTYFVVLGVLPIIFLAEIGFTVAFGVLLDTLIVRSVLVTALNLDIGRHIWWPGKLTQVPDEPAAGEGPREALSASEPELTH